MHNPTECLKAHLEEGTTSASPVSFGICQLHRSAFCSPVGLEPLWLGSAVHG